MLLPLAAVLLAQPLPDAGTQVYDKLVRSTVWIQSDRGTSTATGSGSLIDRRRRLVLTNYHVVGDGGRVTVVFPAFRNGKLVAEREEYYRNIRKIGIPGRVVARDKQHDLALIEIESVPAGAHALPMADKGVTPGQTVHSIGNPGGSGALWVYTPGKVRQVYRKQWRAQLDGRVAEFAAEVVETDSATNPGDSGGPLVNDRGELVAVTQGGALKGNLLSTFIDIAEVKKFLNSAEVRRVTGGDGVAVRRTPLVSHDGAKLVTDETLRQVNEIAAEVYRKTGKDLVLETFAGPPQAKKDEVKGQKPEERARFMREWAEERVKSEDVHGILLLVTRDPRSFHVYVPKDPTIGLTQEDGDKLQQLIRDRFRASKFDDGVTEFAKQAAAMLTRTGP